MNKFCRVLLACFIAVIVAATINFTVGAISGPFTIVEDPLYYVTGNHTFPSTLTTPSCLGGNCKYLYGSTSTVGSWAWDDTTAHTFLIWAYCPTVGESVAKYTWYESQGSWNTTVNQANPDNHGQWVYLGSSDYYSTNNGGYLRLNNDCTNWTCGLKVLYDTMEYNTNP